jgi:hypothetical protein
MEFQKVAATVLGIVALLHLLRAIAGLELVIGTYSLPPWASWIAFVGAGALSYWGWKA